MEKAFKIKIQDFGQVTYTMSELETIKTFDAFENVTVSFSGFEPNGQARVEVSNNDGSLNYVLDKYEALSNGDTVTVSVEINGGEDRYIANTGSIPAEMTKTYTVEGLLSYLSSSADLSDDLFTAMDQQAKDVITSYYVTYPNYKTTLEVESVNYIGNYFLKRKDSNLSFDNNKLYLVYKVRLKYTFGDKKKSERYVELYDYVQFPQIVIDADGLQSSEITDAKMCNDSFEYATDVVEFSFLGTNTYYDIYIRGYDSIDDMFNEIVTKNIKDFNHEDNVADIELGEPTI